METQCIGQVKDDVLIVKLLSEHIVEADAAYAVRDKVIGQVDKAAPKHLVLDMQSVRKMGSIGFLAFLSVRRHLKDGRIVLVSLQKPVGEMFTICRLIPTGENRTAAFEVAVTLEEALALLLE